MPKLWDARKERDMAVIKQKERTGRGCPCCPHMPRRVVRASDARRDRRSVRQQLQVEWKGR